MRVEELIELLREMPPTSCVEIETPDYYGSPIKATYDLGITIIHCDPEPEDDA